uniref:Prp8 binding protein n=2 Tax=Nannochloropsis gaditana (strain CCMP526) TaxID=1093141 RepID=I2CS67_NANGC
MDEGPEDEARRTGADDSALATVPESSGTLAISSAPPAPGRTSHLAASTMLLTGHAAAVYCLQFNPMGDALATGSFDKTILLWDVYEDCKNYNVLAGHTNAVLDLKWSPNGCQIASASADKTLMLWDSNKGTRIRKCKEHTGCVNSVAVAGDKVAALIATASDDRTVKLWDNRSRRSVQTIEHRFQLLAVALSADGKKVFAGGIDNSIQVWDMAKGPAPLDVLEGHSETVTGLSLSPDGKYLLSNAMDNTVRQWDVRPFVTGGRLVQVFQGGTHGSDRNLLRCAWSQDGEMVSAGSADRAVHVWDVPSGQELYYLPGHKGTVNEVVFHPREPVIASASSDKTCYLGELAG